VSNVPNLFQLYATSGGTSGPIRQDGHIIGTANQRGKRLMLMDRDGRTLGYVEQDANGRTTLYRLDGSTASRLGR